MKLDKTKAIFWLGHLGFVGFTAMLLLWLSPAMAAEPAAAASTLPEGAIAWGFLAAAVATGLSALGAGIAVSNVGSVDGSCCLAEVRCLETIRDGKPSTPFMSFGDRVEIDMLDSTGKSIFGRIDQVVTRYQPPR